MPKKLLLQNALLVDCDKSLRGDLLLENGCIAAVGEHLTADNAMVVDASGKAVLPAFVDLHAHFRDPGLTYKEDVESGCRAAVHGGYTAVNLMPNTRPVCSTPEIVRGMRDKAEALGLCQVFQTMSITKDFDGRSLEHLEHLEPSVKWITDDGFGVDDTGVMLRAMEKAKALGIGVMLHEEDSGLRGIDSYLAEELMTFRDVQLACLTGCPTHFCHVSTINAINYILEGKQRCGNITLEVSPHHLALNDATDNRVAPPLRGEEHRLHLIRCVKKGLVDAIATDHAPHTMEEKSAGANGFTGLDLSFATCYTALVKTGEISLEELSGLLSAKPAALLGLNQGKLQVGMAGDVVVIDLDAGIHVTEKFLHSRGKNTPFMGKYLAGEIEMTIRGGEIVYEKAH